ncbi:quinon protein alcohol dehydrogenase-like superfamily [Trichoderma sp. SZMC 28012]
MRSLIEDVFRFVLAHKVGIELAPLQVYSSALIFSPSSSIIRRMYEETERPKWIITKPEMPVEWTARVQCLEGYKSPCTALEFSPDGAQIASTNKDREVRICDLETGVCLHTMKCLENIRLLALSPNGKHLATGSYYLIEIWDLSTSTRLLTFQSEAVISGLAFSFDGTQFAASCSKESTSAFIRTWDLGTGIELKTRNLGTSVANSISFAPDGTYFACVETKYHNPIYIWNSTTDRHLPVVIMNGRSWLVSPKFSADAAQLAAAATDNTIHIFDTLTGACLLKLDQIHGLLEIKFSAASTRLMTKSYHGNLRIWDSITGECLRRFPIYEDSQAAALSPDGMLVASGVFEVEIWDMAIDSPINALQTTIGGLARYISMEEQFPSICSLIGW